MTSIKVTGQDARGNARSEDYVVFLKWSTLAEAFQDAIQWADEEYTCDYEWNEEIQGYKPVGDSYKEFVRITKVELVED